MTLRDLHRLALRYCPPVARWDSLIRDAAWGPAHEIGHALLSLPRERARDNYGLCDPSRCRCPGERCYVVECAAMHISAKLHLAIGRRDLIRVEIDATDEYEYINTRWHWTRAARLLAQRRLTRIPRTTKGLERLLGRRVGEHG